MGAWEGALEVSKVRVGTCVRILIASPDTIPRSLIQMEGLGGLRLVLPFSDIAKSVRKIPSCVSLSEMMASNSQKGVEGRTSEIKKLFWLCFIRSFIMKLHKQ